MKSIVTPSRIKRTEIDWETVSKESMNIEFDSGIFTVLCSELASLRLYQYYKGQNCKSFYSVNLDTFVFQLTTNLK